MQENGCGFVLEKNYQPKLELKQHRKEANYLLALHSSSEILGVAVIDLKDDSQEIKSETFKLGKKLSNKLLTCVNQILPMEYWNQIGRLAVATGPGGFTGTRLTIAMARVIAQQNNCPLDGISSFGLMAARLAKTLGPDNTNNPFWIKKELKRGNIIAGRYQIAAQNDVNNFHEIIELKSPFLISNQSKIEPYISSQDDVYADIKKLSLLSLNSHKNNGKSSWKDILPIYPISPVNQ